MRLTLTVTLTLMGKVTITRVTLRRITIRVIQSHAFCKISALKYVWWGVTVRVRVRISALTYVWWGVLTAMVAVVSLVRIKV